ncbi:MAG: hypothetical protein ACI9Z4_001253, partial [Polaribacter sp.]
DISKYCFKIPPKSASSSANKICLFAIIFNY